MTFSRHLALRSANGRARAGRYHRIVCRSLASEASAATTTTKQPYYPHESLFAPKDDARKRVSENLIQAYNNRNTLLHTTSPLGSEIEPYFKPNEIFVNPPSASQVTVEQLIASQTHFGHSTSLWHPSNSRFIFGVREGIHIISSDITLAHLRRAAKVISSIAERAGTILFVGTRRGQQRMVVKAAQLARQHHLFDEWIAGSITNSEMILGKSRPKVVDEFDQEVQGFDEQIGELPPLKPDLVVCLNVRGNGIMLRECGHASIPTIGIIDTDVNPSWVTYPIPANDDSWRSVALIAMVLGKAGEEGYLARMQAARKGKVLYLPPKGLESEKKDDEGNVVKDSAAEEQRDAFAGPYDTPRTGAGRMGQGSNYVEGGMNARGDGTTHARNNVPIGYDEPDPDKIASKEAKMTPGKTVNLTSDRELESNVNSEVAAHPMSGGPAGNQGTPGPAREMEKEDARELQGGSQVP